MSTRKTTAERIEAARIEKAQKEAEIKRLQQQQRTEERKARTKRLIERGAITESLIPGAETLTHEQFKAFLEKTVTSSYAVRALAEITAEAVTVTTENPVAKPTDPVVTPNATDASRTENGARQVD